MKNYYSENSFFGKANFHPLFVIIFGLSLSITFISSIDFFLSKLTYPILSVSHEDFTHALTQKNTPVAFLHFFLFRITIIQILGFGLMGWLLAISTNYWKTEIYFATPIPLKKTLWAGLIMLIAIPFCQVFMLSENHLTFLSEQDLKTLRTIEEQTQNFIHQIMKSNLLMNIFTFAIVPAICEELFFRAFLFNHFRRFTSVFWAIFWSSLIFSLLHFQIYGFFVRWMMGGMLAFLFYYGKSIHSAIFAHFINNFFTTFVTWLALNGFIPLEIIDHNYQFHYSIVLISFILTALLSYYYFKKYQNEEF